MTNEAYANERAIAVHRTAGSLPFENNALEGSSIAADGVNFWHSLLDALGLESLDRVQPNLLCVLSSIKQLAQQMPEFFCYVFVTVQCQHNKSIISLLIAQAMRLVKSLVDALRSNP